MERVENSSQYRAMVADIKSAATRFTSNCFSEPQLIEKWALDGRLSIVKAPGAILLLRTGFRVLHLYHAAADIDALRQALIHLDSIGVTDPLSADLVGFQPAIEELKQTYVAGGFGPYRCLLRMTHQGLMRQFAAPTQPLVKDASPRLTGLVHEFLLGLLDPFSEQIPSVDDLNQAAERGQILTVNEGQSVAGILIFDRVGQSTTLRYWFVSPNARGKGIGSALMRTFLHRVADSRRIVLWVFSDNDNAIAKYMTYGFKSDGLRDWIMVKAPTRRYRMKSIAEILAGIRPDCDFTNSEDFVEDGLLDSFDVVTLVTELETTFCVTITGTDILPENFRNLPAIASLLDKYGVHK